MDDSIGHDTQNEVLASLASEAKRIERQVSDAKWYLFGSALRNFERALDIDILIVCSSAQEVDSVRHELSTICNRYPLHLFLVTSAEESELGFVASERCVQIHPTTQTPPNDFNLR